jgi:hypothetical protein
MGFTFIVGFLFIKDYRKRETKYFFWISLYFFLFTVARSFRLIVKFYIGEPVWNIGDPAPDLQGMIGLLETIYTILSYIGLFFIYYAMESTTVKKTHYFFSIWVWIVCIVSILDFIIDNIFLYTINLIFFLVLVLGIPLIFLNLAIKSSGSVRRSALSVFIGILLFILSVAMDIPDGKPVFGALPPVIVSIAAPTCTILSCIFFRKGFTTEV